MMATPDEMLDRWNNHQKVVTDAVERLTEAAYVLAEKRHILARARANQQMAPESISQAATAVRDAEMALSEAVRRHSFAVDLLLAFVDTNPEVAQAVLAEQLPEQEATP